MRDYVIRCAQCLKVIRAREVEIIFWKPGDKPFGLHRACEKAYEEGHDEGNLWEARVAQLGAVLLAVLLVGACASAPVTKVGPCTTTPCGDVCCNNDGLVCPPCEEE
jgi:hypothetical protein